MWIQDSAQHSSGRWRIKVVQENGHTMYCFPKFRLGKKETHTRQRHATHSGAIASEQFGQLRDVVMSSGWQHQSDSSNTPVQDT